MVENQCSMLIQKFHFLATLGFLGCGSPALNGTTWQKLTFMSFLRLRHLQARGPLPD